MYYLLELKEKLKKIYGENNSIIRPLVKFIVALASFVALDVSIGYMTKIRNPLIAIVLAALCAFIPGEFTILLLSVFMLAHLYAISAEFCLIALCVVLVMYLLFLRFSPKQGYIIIATVMLCGLKLYAAVPIIIGIGFGISSAIPVSFGIIIYNVIRTASSYESAITSASSVSDTVQQMSYIAESFVNDRACIVTIIAAIVTIIVMGCLKKLTVDNAWTFALVAGALVEFLILMVGMLALNANLNFLSMFIGLVVGVALGYVCKVLLFSVDYKRTEYVQYEDDEYYYYVKAVPKITITGEDVKVKHINGKKTKRADSVARTPRTHEHENEREPEQEMTPEPEEEDI
jgi:hypothetical protein